MGQAQRVGEKDSLGLFSVKHSNFNINACLEIHQERKLLLWY